ncbi:MAG: hypothetical protein E7285_00205 [Lachnospiraceae bacterium]|nr:hypothetical protein [Lachnospiraceae bacterium]
MKKKSIAFIAALLLAACLTACGEKPEETENTSTNEPVTESNLQESQTSELDEEPVAETPEAPRSDEDDIEAKMEAFEIMMDEISNDPDSRKMELWELIYAYCSMIYYEGKTHEEALAQLQEWEDFGNAAALLIDTHRDEIQAGFIAENDVWYSSDFDSLYNEFLSYHQTATENIDTAVKAFTNLNVTNNVIFNENGVSLTFDSFDEANTMFLTLENNNDSNKKVFLYINDIYVNGINITPEYTSLRYLAENDIRMPFTELETGNSTQLCFENLNYDLVEEVYGKLGTDYNNSPFETIQIDYQIQIGTGEEAITNSIVIQTDNYNSDSFSSLFGEHFTTLEITEEYTTDIVVAETYGRFSDTNAVFYIEGITPGTGNGETRIGYFFINNVELANNTDYTMYYLNDGLLLIINHSEDELRRQCEIGNDEPLNVILDMNFVQYTIFTK